MSSSYAALIGCESVSDCVVSSIKAYLLRRAALQDSRELRKMATITDDTVVQRTGDNPGKTASF